MKKSNLWIIGLITAVVTVIGLNVIAGRSNWANERGFGYNRWKQHRHYCDNYYKDNADKAEKPKHGVTDTLNN